MERATVLVATIAALVAPGESTEVPPCRLCGASTVRIGSVHGSYSARDYELRRCGSCRFAFISDPWTELDRIYDDRYYSGAGADPLVDYRFELEQPTRTVRQYEWRGITSVVESLLGGLQGVRWLDYGCGNGGLVRYALQHTGASALGFDQGAVTRAARELGIPILDERALGEHGSVFDVVTAIEVLEHTLDPIGELRKIRELLRPGGLLFLTTGNAAPFADRLLRWSYVIPEIHVSFFEPSTLRFAFERTGFQPARAPRGAGFEEILKFKVLKNLRVRRRSWLTDVLPAGPIAAGADLRVHLREQPIGWAV